MNRLKLKSYDYLVESNLERIKLGKLFDHKMVPYKKEFLLKVLLYLEERERFEDCHFISNLINTRFDHDKNYVPQSF
jgi:hypothetical protein